MEKFETRIKRITEKETIAKRLISEYVCGICKHKKCDACPFSKQLDRLIKAARLTGYLCGASDCVEVFKSVVKGERNPQRAGDKLPLITSLGISDF